MGKYNGKFLDNVQFSQVSVLIILVQIRFLIGLNSSSLWILICVGDSYSVSVAECFFFRIYVCVSIYANDFSVNFGVYD